MARIAAPRDPAADQETATGLAADLVDHLRNSGLDPVTAFQMARGLIHAASVANRANGGKGTTPEIASLLLAATAVVLRMERHQDRAGAAPAEEILATVETFISTPRAEA
jgi:hypothetical protein